MSDLKDQAQKHLAALVPSCPVGLYTHRHGGVYVVYSHSIYEETLAPLVHYYSVDKETRSTRKISVFTELVDGRPRFEWVSNVTDEMLARARSG